MNIIIVLPLVKFTGLGVYAVAGVSTCLAIIKNLFIIITYSAKCLNYKWYKFYPKVIKSVIAVFIGCSIGLLIKRFFVINSWMMLAVFTSVFVIILFAINILFFLNKEERYIIVKYLKDKISRQ